MDRLPILSDEAAQYVIILHRFAFADQTLPVGRDIQSLRQQLLQIVAANVAWHRDLDRCPVDALHIDLVHCCISIQ